VYASRNCGIDNNVRLTYKAGMKLKDWRTRENLSLARMGELIERAHTTVMRLERGENVPDADTMKRIFDATNGEVNLHDFFSADGTPKPQSIQAAE
jgi:transcriptional regulator with XRE-family HTH domain